MFVIRERLYAHPVLSRVAVMCVCVCVCVCMYVCMCVRHHIDIRAVDVELTTDITTCNEL
jgi:hypothetical protein